MEQSGPREFDADQGGISAVTDSSDDRRESYKRQAAACLDMLKTTNDRTSRTVLTAMAHTWLQLTELPNMQSGDIGDGSEYRRRADEAQRMASMARPEDRASWLRLAESWLRLLKGREQSNAPASAEPAGWPPDNPPGSKRSH
jgi:hypothetical protein